MNCGEAKLTHCGPPRAAACEGQTQHQLSRCRLLMIRLMIVRSLPIGVYNCTSLDQKKHKLVLLNIPVCLCPRNTLSKQTDETKFPGFKTRTEWSPSTGYSEAQGCNCTTRHSGRPPPALSRSALRRLLLPHPHRLSEAMAALVTAVLKTDAGVPTSISEAERLALGDRLRSAPSPAQRLSFAPSGHGIDGGQGPGGRGGAGAGAGHRTAIRACLCIFCGHGRPKERGSSGFN